MIPALIMGGASILGGILGGSSAKKAAREQAQAQQAATDESRRQFDTSLELTAPWRQEGQNALARLGAASTGDMSQFYASPDYQFRRDEGMRDLGGSFAARGGAFSGNALRALSDFNSATAAGEYGQWWNRQAGLAGGGMQTAGQNAQGAIQTGQLVGNSLVGAGDARASGIMGNANSVLGGVNNALNTWATARQPAPNPWGMGTSSFVDYSRSGYGPGPWAPPGR